MIPRVVKVVPFKDYTVDVYFDDGKIVSYNPAKSLTKLDFNKIKDTFSKCTVVNGTLAWDICVNQNETKCFGIDPIVLHELPAKYLFEKLTPVIDADISVYEDAINFVFNEENMDIRNVAISGSYGSGKSSILASYEKEHKKNFIYISLTHFQAVEQEKKVIQRKGLSEETIIEGKILNQLLHQIQPEKIPQTNFRMKRGIKRGRIIVPTIFISAFLGSVVLLFSKTRVHAFIDLLAEDSRMRVVLSFLFHPNAYILVTIVGTVCFGKLIYSLVKWLLLISPFVTELL